MAEKKGLISKIRIVLNSMMGFGKKSPSGDYPGNYTHDTVKDGAQQLANAKALFDQAKQNGQVEQTPEELNETRKFAIGRAAMWFGVSVVFMFGTKGLSGLYHDIAANLVIYSTLTFSALSLIQAYRCKRLLKKQQEGVK